MYKIVWCAAAVTIASTAAFGSTAHFPVKIYVDSGNPGTVLTQGDNTINTTQIGCPRQLTSCTLVLTAMDTVCNLGQQTYTIIVKVDGVSVDNGVPIFGTSDGCIYSTWVGNTSIVPGKHKIVLDTNYGANFDATQGQWSVNYDVTTP